MSRILTAEHIKKSFGKNTILKDINLTVEKGDVISILGPSGTGKTTLLRCFNYLEKPEAGRLSIDDAVCGLFPYFQNGSAETPAEIYHGLPAVQSVPQQECP